MIAYWTTDFAGESMPFSLKNSAYKLTGSKLVRLDATFSQAPNFVAASAFLLISDLCQAIGLPPGGLGHALAEQSPGPYGKLLCLRQHQPLCAVAPSPSAPCETVPVAAFLPSDHSGPAQAADTWSMAETGGQEEAYWQRVVR